MSDWSLGDVKKNIGGRMRMGAHQWGPMWSLDEGSKVTSPAQSLTYGKHVTPWLWLGLQHTTLHEGPWSSHCVEPCWLLLVSVFHNFLATPNVAKCSFINCENRCHQLCFLQTRLHCWLISDNIHLSIFSHNINSNLSNVSKKASKTRLQKDPLAVS